MLSGLDLVGLPIITLAGERNEPVQGIAFSGFTAIKRNPGGMPLKMIDHLLYINQPNVIS